MNTLKALLLLKIFNFLSWLFHHVEKRVDTEDNVNLDDQTMKFGQLIEYSMGNVKKLFSDPFLKNQNWAYLWVDSLKLYTVWFCMPRGLLKYIETKLKTAFSYLIYSFLENKNRSWTSLPASFFIWLLKKHSSFYILLTDQISLTGCLYFARYCAISLLHLIRAIARSHASTRATSLMRTKNSTRHFSLWYLLSGTFKWRKWKKRSETSN